ncbi:MAG: hypothetical protein ACOC2N_00100 [Spirochaetota bacterium]
MSDLRRTIGGLPHEHESLSDEALAWLDDPNASPRDGRTLITTIADKVRDLIATTSATDDTSGRVLRIDDYLDRAGPSDSAWTTTTSLSNGWTGTVRYIKRAGMVTVIVEGVDGTSSTWQTVVNLPSDYRPSTTIRGVVTNGAAVSRFAIVSAGVLSIADTTGANLRGSVTYPVIT